MKKLSVISLVLVLVLSLAGCTRSGEIALYKGFQRTLDINSMESETEISFTVDGEGLDEASQGILEQAKDTLNSSKFHINQKQSTNKEGTKGQAEMNLGADVGGVKTDVGIWVDMDLSNDNSKIVEIIKMPQMLMGAYGPEAVGKEYIVMDMNNMTDGEDLGVDFSQLMNLSKDLQPKMEKFMETYFDDFKLDEKIVSYQGKKEINGEYLSVYHVNLNDESLKSLLRSTVNYSLENEDSMEFIKDYMKLVSSAMEMTGTQEDVSNEEIQQEIEEGLKELETNLPKFKEDFNKLMDDIEDVKIIGDKGINIEYGIDKKGYIVSQKSSIDLIIDLASVSKAVSGQVEMPEGEEIQLPTGVINLGINMNSSIKNINKDLKIILPEINEKNSIDFTKLMEGQLKQLEEFENKELPQAQ